jgi:lysophospholipase L1-like esterase
MAVFADSVQILRLWIEACVDLEQLQKPGVPCHASPRDDPLHGQWDFVHPNALGAAELARRVLDELVARGWVDLPTTPSGEMPAGG